jgi:hypothetical protein
MSNVKSEDRRPGNPKSTKNMWCSSQKKGNCQLISILIVAPQSLKNDETKIPRAAM